MCPLIVFLKESKKQQSGKYGNVKYNTIFNIAKIITVTEINLRKNSDFYE